MRSTVTNFNEKIELEVAKSILSMWDKIENRVKENGTSISKIANKANLNASAIYHAIRKTRKTPLYYVDTPVDTIIALAKELDMDIDDLL